MVNLGGWYVQEPKRADVASRSERSVSFHLSNKEGVTKRVSHLKELGEAQMRQPTQAHRTTPAPGA